jgi:hypothetical protein
MTKQPDEMSATLGAAIARIDCRQRPILFGVAAYCLSPWRTASRSDAATRYTSTSTLWITSPTRPPTIVPLTRIY